MSESDRKRIDWEHVLRGTSTSDVQSLPPTPKPIPPDLKEAVSEFLFQAQMIEQMLKAVLHDIAVLTELVTEKKIRYRSNVQKDKRTLGQLVRAFAVHAVDEDLATRLNAFVSRRNKAAHVAYVFGYVHAESAETIAQAKAAIEAWTKEAMDLLDKVTGESARSYELIRDRGGHA